MCPLAVHAAVFDEAAGRAVLELDGVAPALAAVGACFVAAAITKDAVHSSIDAPCACGGSERRVRVRHKICNGSDGGTASPRKELLL